MDKILFDQVPDLFASVGDLFVEKKEELCRDGCQTGRRRSGPDHEQGLCRSARSDAGEAAGAAGDVGKMLMKAGMKMSSSFPPPWPS